MNTPTPSHQGWRKVLQTPVSELLRGRITGPVSPLELLDTSMLPESVIEAIDAVTKHFSGLYQRKITRQLVNSCKTFLQEGRGEAQLVAQLNAPESLASLVRLTGTADWVLTSPMPPRLWPTVDHIVGTTRVRTRTARKMFYRVCRSMQWQLEAGQTPEELADRYGETIALGGLLYETHSPQLLLDYNLPENLACVVLDVVQRSRLRIDEKLDTARELCAHFADGLEKGNTQESLIKSFGPPKTAARLIRRACFRNRSFAWRTWRRTWQATAVISSVVLVVWTILAVRFLSAMPTVTFDIIQEVDDQSRAIPKQERAWPLYRTGLIKLSSAEKMKLHVNSNAIYLGLTEGPQSKHWLEAKEYLNNHTDTVALYLEATNRPKLGFINRDPNNRDWLLSAGHGENYILNPPDRVGFEILLPQAQDLSAHVGSLLKGAFHLAVEEGNSERGLQLLLARLAVAEHYRQSGPYVICQIGANGIISDIAQDIAQIVIEQPEFFNNEQLATLFQRLSATEFRPLNFETSEKCLKDYVQKIYTDDGTGNGRFAAVGFPILQRMNNLMNKDAKQLLLESLFSDSASRISGESNTLEKTTSQVLAAPVAAMFADRKEMQEKLLFMNELLWKQRTTVTTVSEITDSAYLTEYRRIASSPSLRLKYLPVLVMMPYETSPTYWSATPRNQVQRDAALVTIAAEHYRRQQGAFPETVEELVPLLLSEVPIDPYTNQPLRYLIRDGQPTIDSFGLKHPE